MNNIQSWNGSGINSSIQSHWLDKGERDCVRLTLEDGRILECTPEHLIMLSDRTWMMANEILEKRVMTGVNYPVILMNKEIE